MITPSGAMATNYYITVQNYVNNNAKRLHELQQKGVLCDIKLLCKDGQVLVHELILMSCQSKYFYDKLKVTLGSRKNGIPLDDFSTKSVNQIIAGLYTGQFIVFNEQVAELLDLSIYLGLDLFTSFITTIINNNSSLKVIYEQQKGIREKIKTHESVKIEYKKLCVLDSKNRITPNNEIQNADGKQQRKGNTEKNLDDKQNHGQHPERGIIGNLQNILMRNLVQKEQMIDMPNNKYNLGKQAPVTIPVNNKKGPLTSTQTNMVKANTCMNLESIVSTDNSSHSNKPKPIIIKPGSQNKEKCNKQQEACLLLEPASQSSSGAVTKNSHIKTSIHKKTKQSPREITSKRVTNWVINIDHDYGHQGSSSSPVSIDYGSDEPISIDLSADGEVTVEKTQMEAEEKSKPTCETTCTYRSILPKESSVSITQQEGSISSENLKKPSLSAEKKQVVPFLFLKVDNMVAPRVNTMIATGNQNQTNAPFNKHQTKAPCNKDQTKAPCNKDQTNAFSSDEQTRQITASTIIPKPGQLVQKFLLIPTVPPVLPKLQPVVKNQSKDCNSQLAFNEPPTVKKKKTKQVSCNICKRKIRDKYNLAIHIRSKHTGEKPFQCEICGCQFAAMEYFRKHLAQHEGYEKVKCDVCGKGFCTNSDLRKHKVVHGPKDYLCYLCGKTIATKYSYSTHMKKHNGELPFECTICGMRFLNIQNQQKHIRRHNKEEYHFSCEVCQKRFFEQSALEAHMAIHAKKVFKCRLCEQEIYSKYEYIKHRKEHQNLPFNCTDCGKRFNDQQRYIVHRAKHTGQKLLYVCSICGKSFHNNTTRVNHMVIHGEKRHKCVKCGKAFARRDNLIRHLKSTHKDGIHVEIPKLPIGRKGKKNKKKEEMFVQQVVDEQQVVDKQQVVGEQQVVGKQQVVSEQQEVGKQQVVGEQEVVRENQEMYVRHIVHEERIEVEQALDYLELL